MTTQVQDKSTQSTCAYAVVMPQKRPQGVTFYVIKYLR